MSGKAEVQFEVLPFPDVEPVVALVFVKDGQPLPPNGRVFTFELTPGTSKIEADTLVNLLNRHVLRLFETRSEPSLGAEAPPARHGGGAGQGVTNRAHPG